MSSTSAKPALLSDAPALKKSRQPPKRARETDTEYGLRVVQFQKLRIRRLALTERMFDVYQNDWLPTNPPVLSRSNIGRIVAEFTNVTSPTITANYMSTTFVKRQMTYCMV